MKFASKRATTIVISLFLALTIVTLVLFPPVYAHDPPWNIKTYAYVNAAPNPVGVGQQISVTGWIDKVPPTAEGNWGYMWHNMKITVTRPDGTTETLGPFPSSDAVGGVWAWYTPTQTGSYKFVLDFPAQVVWNENPYPYFSPFIEMNKAFINDTYLASTSAPYYVTVQEDPVESNFPANPLPTEYWSRPINSMNREWYPLGGDWLGLRATSFGATGVYDQNQNFNPYTTAPNTAHVVWTEPLAFGGQIGGEFGGDDTALYATGTAYEAKFNAVILYGILYYTEYPGAGNNPAGLKAVDMRTGETVWEKPILTPLRVGMVYDFMTGDQYGAHAYLFCAQANMGFVNYPLVNEWEMYDAMTGEFILKIANVSSGTLVRGDRGEILSYTVGGGMLRLWNVSKCIAAGQQKYIVSRIYSAQEIWRPPMGYTIDWNDGYEWNATIPTQFNGAPLSLSISRISDDYILMAMDSGAALGAGVPGGHGYGWRVDACYSAVDGHQLWAPVNRTLIEWGGVAIANAGDGVYTEYTRQTMTYIGYSLENGQKLWGPTQPFNSTWAYYDWTAPSVIGYGNFYAWGLAGEVYCWDVHTGALKWSWNSGASGIDSPFGSWPLGTWSNHNILADGKLYVRAGHDYTPPVFKGAKLYCLNATTGELVWDTLSFDIIGSPACADGYMVWFNGYDNQVHCYSKGPSATTVAANPKVSVHGSSVLVEGTVMDKSPGTKDSDRIARFPNGVPAIADEDMSTWMEYVYQQQPLPTNAKGVDVIVEVFDPNSNYYEVGRATSDATGFYSLAFTPEVPGKYTVVARFAGSESYYSSFAETAINVEQAPEATPQSTQPPTSLAEQYFLPVSIGLFAAIALVGIAILLMLRKK